MAAPTQITVSYLVYSNASPAVITTATQIIPVPTILQNLDSSAGSNQTGFNAFDSLLSAIAKRKGVSWTTPATGTQNFVPLSNIILITSP